MSEPLDAEELERYRTYTWGHFDTTRLFDTIDFLILDNEALSDVNVRLAGEVLAAEARAIQLAQERDRWKGALTSSKIRPYLERADAAEQERNEALGLLERALCSLDPAQRETWTDLDLDTRIETALAALPASKPEPTKGTD